ncbi:phytoene/squalene synthase family protein [Cryomorphaceae bacterium 1068]|nr:phytoene/squalene synthase family protein [Cryomorphaceae bacterium 1068]
MKQLFDDVSVQCSKLTTKAYSTSFSLGIRFLAADLRDPIYSIYGFVRFADEIVDTFHGFDKKDLLDRFKADTYRAIEEGISLNPILNSFQYVVNEYKVDLDCIETFLKSMEMDLYKDSYSKDEYDNYILGSAEVVGLMCLSVFLRGDERRYAELKPFAMKLGSAFQKINFLRDLHADYKALGRTYFPGVDLQEFGEEERKAIEKDIEADFAMGYEGIKMLPKDARFGVFVAYVYYFKLFKKIRKKTTEDILSSRVRISDKRKFALFFSSYVRHSFNLL